jgi:hypothetical protein
MGVGLAAAGHPSKSASLTTSPLLGHSVCVTRYLFNRGYGLWTFKSFSHHIYVPVWTSGVSRDRWSATKGAFLSHQHGGDSNIGEIASTTGNVISKAPVSELFQSAVSSLDLFSPSSSASVDEFDPQEDITVDHGQTAASVGRAIYEVVIQTLKFVLVPLSVAYLASSLYATKSLMAWALGRLCVVYHVCVGFQNDAYLCRCCVLMQLGGPAAYMSSVETSFEPMDFNHVTCGALILH